MQKQANDYFVEDSKCERVRSECANTKKARGEKLGASPASFRVSLHFSHLHAVDWRRKSKKRHWKDLDLRCLHCQRKTATSSPAGNPAQIPANKESASRNTDVSKKKGGVGGSSPRCLLRFNINNIARITATQQLNVHTSRVLV